MKNATKRNEIEHYETQNIFDLIINEIYIKKKSFVNIRAKEILFRITEILRK